MRNFIRVFIGNHCKENELENLKQLLLERGVKQSFPKAAECGVARVLREFAAAEYLCYSVTKRKELCKTADELEQLVNQWDAKFPPLIAVTGLRNAGKSSLVKSFLSDPGRSRTPTGLDMLTATRRYVFWLPESWRETSFQHVFFKVLKQVFGHGGDHTMRERHSPTTHEPTTADAIPPRQ